MEHENDNSQFQYYKIKLAAPLPPGEKVQITVRTSLTNLIHAFPTHVGQAEKQKFVFFGNPFALTAYPATKQKTTVMYVHFFSYCFFVFWMYQFILYCPTFVLLYSEHVNCSLPDKDQFSASLCLPRLYSHRTQR